MNFVLILAIIASILLILVVLIQNPKGGGIAANFSSGNQILGVRRTNEFIEKITWILAGVLLVLALIATMNTTSPTEGPQKSILQEKIDEGDLDNATTPGLNDLGPVNGQGGNMNDGNTPDGGL